jgi:hypothetical protein
MLYRTFRKGSLTLVNGIHHINPTPWGIHFFANHPVTGTSGEAKPAVNTGIYQFLLWGMIGIKTWGWDSRRGLSINWVFL